MRLKEMAQALRAEVDSGPPDGDTRLDFLWRLVEAQHRVRQERAVERRIREARFPATRTLDGFDFDFQPNLDRDQILELATLDFIPRGFNVLLGGMSGTGKSHLAIALGLAACAAGFRVRYTTSADLLMTLFASLATNELSEALKPYRRCDLLIIDEVGLDRAERDLSRDASLFYRVIQDRYENTRSTIITTNIKWADWPEYLGDPIATASIIDRLIHRGYRISIKGPSWRAEAFKRLNHIDSDDHAPHID